MTPRTLLVRSLASLALFAVYFVSVSTLMVAGTAPAAAQRGRGRGRGRGNNWGGVYIAPPIYSVAPAPRCYWSRRWRRTICRY
jgi:hypothetical protein